MEGENNNNETIEDGTNSPESSVLVDQATKAAQSLKEQNDRAEELLKKSQKIATLNALGGHGEAGNAKEAPKVETPRDYVKRLLSNDL